jgi:hypothetical protein
MSRQIAKVKSTGGYGFKFEDKVAATCLIRMFDGLEIFGLKGLRVRGITFQAHASGWLLDDLLLDLSGPSGECKCAVSVKSAAYLTKDGFKSEFVADLWDQWHGADRNPFESNRDYLALAVGRLSEAASTAWEDIAKQAPLSDPQHLANQLSTDGSSSPIERKIFASLLPDAELKKGTTVADAARLLSRLGNALVVIDWPTPGLAKMKLFKCDSEGADPPRFSPEPTCQVFGSNLVANCAESYGSAGVTRILILSV